MMNSRSLNGDMWWDVVVYLVLVFFSSPRFSELCTPTDHDKVTRTERPKSIAKSLLTILANSVVGRDEGVLALLRGAA